MATQLLISVVTAALLIAAIPLHAEIYHWQDEKGIRRYTNTLPPRDIKVRRQVEIPFDAAAYEARRAYEAQAQANRRIQREREKNSQLRRQLKATQDKLTQLEIKTNKALEMAETSNRIHGKASKRHPKFYYPRPGHTYRHQRPYPGLKPYPGLRPYSLRPNSGPKWHGQIKDYRRFRSIPRPGLYDYEHRFQRKPNTRTW